MAADSRKEDERIGAALAAAGQHASHAALLVVGETLATPIPILDPSGGFDSWFVPIVAGDVLPAYLRLSAELGLVSCSRFGRPQDCKAWLDPLAITKRALEHAGTSHALAPPVLSFDSVPARIAWRVVLASGTIFVAGETVYRARP